MRIPINLASEPFRRDRSMLVASGAVGLALLLLLVFLVRLSADQRAQASAARGQVTALQGRLTALASEETRLQAVLRQPANAEVLERSVFLNSLILPKSVSWTRLFADLETVMPPDVRLISVRPQVVNQNQVQLDMVVGAEGTPAVLNLLMKMETSPVFGATSVFNTFPPSQTEPLYRFRLSARYGQRL